MGKEVNLRNMSHKVGGMFPNQINKELAKALLRGTKRFSLKSIYTSKVLKEFEDANNSSHFIFSCYFRPDRISKHGMLVYLNCLE